jgi:hypothetical protein
VRNIRKTEAFDEFYNSVNKRVQEKIDYALTLIAQIKVVSAKFVKKLEGTDFFEMRVSVENEYRVIIFTIDEEIFIEANEILLLNGFLKKSTKDYKPQLKKAEEMIKGLSE